MTSRQVKSAAGETIELVDDNDWALTAGVTLTSLRQWQGVSSTKPLVLRALWEHGRFTHETGRVSSEVLSFIRNRYHPDPVPRQSNILSVFQNPVNNPAVETVIRGKRGFSIRLVALPETWYRKLLADIGSPAVPVPAEPPGMPPVDEPPPLELHIANQVAMSLLTSVVEIITAGKADNQVQKDLQEARGLLAARLAENERLRNQVRQAGDTINALTHERDGLRTRLRQTEHNLGEVLKGETAQAVNHEIQKRVDSIMRTAPTTKGD